MPTRRSRLGSRGEDLARGYLSEKGYAILETNYRCQWGEVDIIARDGQCLVFVEVRTRRGGAYGTPEESITREKAQRLIATAQSYLEERNIPGREWRIDLVSVELDQRGRLEPLRHIQNAVEEASSP